MLEVGKICKPHGLRGEVVVELFTNRTERLEPGSVLQAGPDSLVVRRSQPHQHRWIVRFAGVETREAADALRGVILKAEPIEDPDALWVHELQGAEVLDVNGDRIGNITGIYPNPAGDLLEIDDTHLVPLRFVVEHGPGFVRVDPPAGIFDLQ